jgi:uncharacterized protein
MPKVGVLSESAKLWKEALKMIDTQIIEIIKDKLVAVYNPITIYLFGSYAWGEPNEDSDIDMLVIINHSEEKPNHRLKPAYATLRGLGVPKDILIYTKEEFDRNALEPSTLFYKVKNEGVKLYEVA